MFPSENQQFQQGQRIEWSINYEGTVYFIYPVFWNERGLLDTAEPGTKLLLSKYGASGDLARRYRVNPIIPAYPEPINPSKNEFSIEMGQDLVRAIAWQEWANSACNASDSLRWAHYCPQNPDFKDQYHVISNSSGDFGVMQINRYYWKDFFNNPKNKSGNHTGWDWTQNDWRENIRDGKAIMFAEADKCINVYWPNILSEQPLLDHIRVGIYHHGCGWLNNLVRLYPQIPERKDAVYTYSPDGTRYVYWVQQFMIDKPWTKIP